MHPGADGAGHGGSPVRGAHAAATSQFTQFQTLSASHLEATLGPLVESEGGGPEGWAEALAAHLRLLVERNEQVNLVSRKSINEVVRGQLLPSLAALRTVRPGEVLRVLDVGTGGGFPGIPIAILRPMASVALVEATQKKCAFLEEVVRALALTNAAVYRSRIEAPTPQLLAAAPFDVALARAVGQTERLRGAVLPLLCRGAEFWAFAPPSEPNADPWPSADAPVTALLRIARR